MATDDPSPHSDDGSTGAPPSEADTPVTPGTPPLTRASAIWMATGVALVLLVLLIVFILQNSTKVGVHFLGLSETIPLGMALLIASVGGGVVVAIAGVARITQLRKGAHRSRGSTPVP